MIPIINDTRKKFTAQDSLSLASETNALQDTLCPVIKSNTYRAFYWPFLVWNYYEYIYYTKVTGIPKQTADFNHFTRRNDYFFVLGNLLSNQDDDGLVGKRKTNGFIVPDKTLYEFNENYLTLAYGGMGYYKGSVEDIGYIKNEGGNNSFPKINKIAEPLVDSFVEAVKDTRYYKEYLHADGVPTDVLIDWGEHVNLSMENFTKCKEILKEDLFGNSDIKMFENKKSLIESTELLRLLINDMSGTSSKEMRILLFENYYLKVPKELQNITISWETVVARQYFTFSIELMWKALLNTLLNTSCQIPMDTWIDKTISESSVNPNDLTQDIIKIGNCNATKIEEILDLNINAIDKYIEHALIVLFSIYNRYKNRELPNKRLLMFGKDVSIAELINCIDNCKKRPIKVFIHYIAKEWILNRHLKVAISKMSYGMDAYCFFTDGNRCFSKPEANEIQPGFGNFKLIPLMQVMKDLEMLNG